ncbi:MAG: hypothetical protein WBE37_05360 [Bryobacteraceae bacterium]
MRVPQMLAVGNCAQAPRCITEMEIVAHDRITGLSDLNDAEKRLDPERASRGPSTNPVTAHA